MPKDEWFYSKGDQKLGPVPTAELKEMAGDGRLAPTDLIWREGMADWTPAGKAQNLFPANQPPPLPGSQPPPLPASDPSPEEEEERDDPGPRSAASRSRKDAETAERNKKLMYGGIAAGVLLLLVVVVGMSGGAGGRLTRSRIVSNETSAVASLVVILCGQATFHRTDFYGRGQLMYANPHTGRGFVDLYAVGNQRIGLIDQSLAKATSPRTAKAGYYFISFRGSADGYEYDPVIEFGVCAVPAVYGKTGINTFVMDVGGSVYMKDTGGVAPTRYPDVRRGWIAVGG